jgi:hypothetical protein
MMSRKRLRARQQAMKRRHHCVPRPYDHARVERREESRQRLRRLFEMNASDEFIANAFSISLQGVRLLRLLMH